MQFFKQRQQMQAVWLKSHLYLAIAAGLFFALMGLSGSISVYREELDELLNPSLVIENPQGSYQSLDRIIASVHSAHPSRYGSWTLEMPKSSHGMITAWYEKPTETFFEMYAPLMVSVNPYTAEVVASRFWGSTATTWLLDLHTQLGLGRTGWNAVGILGLLLIASCSTGLYLWWPGISKLAQVFKLRKHEGLMQMLSDAHRLLGLLSASVLIMLAFTGFLLSFPSALELLEGSTGMEHGQTGRNIISTAIPNNHPTNLSAASIVARGLFPRAELRRVTTPAGDIGIYRINLRQSSEINQRHPYTTVWVDRWSGQIREVRNPVTFTQGEIFASWIWPLHTGEAFGVMGRFIWFISGLSLFVLYVSGMLRWLWRIGKIQDRQLNVAKLRPHVKRMHEITCRLGGRLWLLICWMLKKTKQSVPYILAGSLILCQWVNRLRLIILRNSKNRIKQID